MAKLLAHLGPFSDLAPLAIRANKLYRTVKPGLAASKRFLAGLNFNPRAATPIGVKVEKRWTADGVDGEVLSWSVGYGPRTQAWLFKPAGMAKNAKLPGALVCHDHGAYKYYGKEKVADGPEGPLPELVAYREEYYGKLPIANTLAKRGYAVLVHDTFLWGSRKFPYEVMAAGAPASAEAFRPDEGDKFPEISRYNALAGVHEHIANKYATVLGTSMAGIVNFEDRVAASVLAGRKDVVPGGIACLGLSGGGMRTVLMNATCPLVKCAIPVGAMTTYAGLLDSHIVSHTWMLYPPEFPKLGDWSDAVACRAPSPLFVIFCANDQLYTLKAQQDAHRRIAGIYKKTRAPKNYQGKFYPTLHTFNLDMQADAWPFLDEHMKDGVNQHEYVIGERGLAMEVST